MAAKKNIKFGFTVVELLIGLAITAMLLTAVAVAFNAAAQNYNENREAFNVINSARQALTRITNQLRTAIAVSPTDPANQCSVITAENQNIIFSYNTGDDTLYISAGGHLYPLCRNVTNMSFSRTTAVNGLGQTYVKSVEMSMTVQAGNNVKTLNSAVVLRKTLF